MATTHRMGAKRPSRINYSLGILDDTFHMFLGSAMAEYFLFLVSIDFE